MAVHRPHRIFLAGRELPTSWTSFAEKRPPRVRHGLDGNVFPEGDEADLVVTQDDVALRVEHLRAHPDAPGRVPALFAVVVAEEEVEAVLAHHVRSWIATTGVRSKRNGSADSGHTTSRAPARRRAGSAPDGGPRWPRRARRPTSRPGRWRPARGRRAAARPRRDLAQPPLAVHPDDGEQEAVASRTAVRGPRRRSRTRKASALETAATTKETP
jgi:hypothetical protein